MIFKSDIVAILSLATLNSPGYTVNGEYAKDSFFGGTNTFDNAPDLEGWSLLVNYYFPSLELNSLYKLVMTHEGNSLTALFKVKKENSMYNFSLVKDKGTSGSVITNWSVDYDSSGFSGTYKSFHLETLWSDNYDGVVFDFSENYTTRTQNWTQTSLDSTVRTRLITQLADLKTESASLEAKYIIEKEF